MASDKGDQNRERTTTAASIFVIPEDALVIVPIRNVVLFPGMILPLTIGRQQPILAAQQAVKTERPVGILLQRDAEVEVPGPEDMCLVGTVANLLRYVTLPDNTHVIVCQGLQRFRAVEYLPGYPFPVARIARIDEAEVTDSEIEARTIQLRERALEVLRFLPQVSQELASAIKNIAQAGALADLVASVAEIKIAERQQVLETLDLRRRLDVVLDCLHRRLEVLRLSREIDQRTKASIDQHQREYLLREQLKSIQNELGEGDAGNSNEMAALRKAVAEARMPEEVANQANKELKRLERMSDGSAEYSMIRAYLDWLVELPWQEPDPDRIEIAEARRILEGDHFGLDQIKKRIIEFLAVRKLNPSGHGPILCFVGPPGVGKTSLGQSIARRWGGSSCVRRWAVVMTRPKSGVTGAPTSVPCPGTSFRRSAKRDRGVA